MFANIALLLAFFGLPIMAGEWDGPFWIQAVLMLLMLAPLAVMALRGVKNAPTYEEWEKGKVER